MLKTKEGHFLMVVKVGGFCFQTADQAEIDMRLSSRNTLIRSMNDSRFAVYSHIIRREVRQRSAAISITSSARSLIAATWRTRRISACS